MASAHHGDTDLFAAAPPPGSGVLYHQYLLLEQELQELQTRYPNYFKYSVIGQSVLGLNLYGIEVTNFKSSDPPLDQRYRLYFDGSIHSNEQLGMEMVLDIAHFLLDEYDTNATAKWIVDNRHTFVVPLVNPDGNVKDSRHNTRLVDLNRNFPHGWGGPGSSNKGDAPASEPETQAIIAFLQTVRPHYLNSFHTGTLMLLHPYGNKKDKSPDHDLFTKICELNKDAMAAASGGQDVPCGPVYTTIYPASGATVDYAYYEFGTNSWTFEVDGEQFLLATLEPPRTRLGEAWVAVEHAFLNVHKYGALLTLGPLQVASSKSGIEFLTIQVTNEGLGASNRTEIRLQSAEGSLSLNVPVDSLQPQETREITLTPPALSEGQRVDLQVVYNKTVYKGFSENVTLHLQVVEHAGILTLDRAGKGSVHTTVTGGGIPGFDAALLLGTLVTLGWVYRRKSR